jgi:UDP-glucose 4-epimerase
MKILVTGGAGFIGSHTVAELIEAGFAPIILDDFRNSQKSVLEGLYRITGQEIPFYEGDCNDAEMLENLFRSEAIGGVIHFAAYKAVGESVEQPLKYYENNLHSTVLLLKTMKRFGVNQLVFSSSCTVYGQPEQLPVTEQTPRAEAASPYGNTKIICEDIIRHHVASKPGLKAISLRYFNPIGAHPSAEIGELPYLTQVAAGIRKQLTVFGNDYRTPDGTCIRDFIHVVDLAKAHVAALKLLSEQAEMNYYDIFNIGTGQGNSVLELIHTFEEVNQVKLNYKFGPGRPGDVEQIYAEVEKANKFLKWKAERSLSESLRDAWRRQKKMLQPEASM